MKKIYNLLFLSAFLVFVAGCQPQTPVHNNTDIMPVILLVPHYPLEQADKEFFKRVNPYGFLLSIPRHRDMDPNQLRKELETVLGRNDFLFFLDQEGGSVNRLRQFDPTFRSPAANYYGEVAKENVDKAISLAREEGIKTGKALKKLSIDVVFAPVADIIDSDNVFRRERYYSADPKVSKALSDAFAIGLAEGGVIPCYKHFVGFPTEQDSHRYVPEIDASVEAIEAKLPAFEESKKYGCLMTEHAVYSAIDKHYVSTYSSDFYKFVRNKFRFEGLVITDALNMVAAGGPNPNAVGYRMNNALAAGADVVMPFFPMYASTQFKEEKLRQIKPEYIKRFQSRVHLLKRPN